YLRHGQESALLDADTARREPRLPLHPRARHVGDVRHDADGRRHLTRATAGEEARTERAALDEHAVQHVVRVADAAPALHHRRVGAELQRRSAIAADTQVLDVETEALGEAEIRAVYAANALDEHLLRIHLGAEGEHREHDELLRGV